MIPYNETYDKIRHHVPLMEWAGMAKTIERIEVLKKDRNAVILAHNYMTPEIYHGVADFVGDSLELAKLAAKSDADVIVQAGVHFMAETSKLLAPDKTVLIPDLEAGCSLSESITATDVRALRKKHPGVPVVVYANTSAEVKAEADITCTSSNAVKIVESLGVPEVMFLPDAYLADWVAKQTKVTIIGWHGTCVVHEQFNARDLQDMRSFTPGLKIIAHPECCPSVLEEADFTGSTAAMINYVKDEKPKDVLMVTECSMSDNISAENPDTNFVRPCNLCPYMKRVTLDGIHDSLRSMQYEIKIDEKVADAARESVQRMVDTK